MNRDEILAWVEAHRDSLPSNLDELARFPIPFRKVIATVVPHERRLAFWREHLESFVGDNSELSTEQQSFVREAALSLPTLLAKPAPNPEIVAWEARLAALFSRQAASRIFGTLGPAEPPEGLPIPADAHPGGGT
jgi:hypothetical protein